MIQHSRSHLQTTGERYFEHMRFASTVGLLAIGAGLACLLHSLLPALCTRTASRTIRHLAALFDEREKLPEVRAEATDLMAFVVLMILASAITGSLLSSSIPPALACAYSALAFSIPLALLLVNRELEFQDGTGP